jgi:hypothetical protein
LKASRAGFAAAGFAAVAWLMVVSLWLSQEFTVLWQNTLSKFAYLGDKLCHMIEE